MGGFIIAGCLFGTICSGLSPDGRWYVAPPAAPQAQYRCMVGDPRCEVLPPLGWRLEPLRPPGLPRNAIPPTYAPPQITMPRQPLRRQPPAPRVDSRPLPPVSATPPTVELRRAPPAPPPEELDGGPVVPLEPSPPSRPPRPYIQR